MKCKISKWGNSYAIRVPKEIIEEYNLVEDSTLTIQKKAGEIILKKSPKREKLTELLGEMEPQEEMDWGDARGKEIW